MIYLGQNIKKLRKEMKLTQDQFGDLFCIPGKTIQAYENRGIEMPYQKLIVLSRYFKISIEDLLTKQL